MTTANALQQLMELSTVVPETADLETIRRLRPRDVSLSTARLRAAAQEPAHADLVAAAIGRAQKEVGKGGRRALVAVEAVDRLSVEFGAEILRLIPGRVSVELDGRLAYQTTQMVERAVSVVEQFEARGVERERVLVKIPATWEGVRAARRLRRRGVLCHMTLVFGPHQVAASIQAGASVIAPSVGRIYDWHKKEQKAEDFAPAADPGVQAAARMQAYCRRHAEVAALLPSTFRSLAQALELAGADAIALPPTLLAQLAECNGPVEPKLGPEALVRWETEDLGEIDEARFAAMQQADPVALAKLDPGVKNLSWAFVSLEKELGEWIAKRQDEAASSSTTALFAVWDYDGDGHIDREEWAGTDEVFNALDRNHDGRISLEEMAAGLGAPFKARE